MARSAAAALEVDPLEGQIRQVFFFDTPDLALDAAWWRAPAGSGQGRRLGGEAAPGDRGLAGVRAEAFGIVVTQPGGYVCSASMKGSPDTDVRETVMGRHPIGKLFSKHQRALFEQHAPAGVDLNGLAVLGPLFVLKLKFRPEELDYRLVAEMWLYPDGSRVIELSTKCPPSETFQVAAEMRAFLTERGVSAGGEQQTKTRKALDFFAAELAT